MVAPFLGLPVLVATLALSVDLIEYAPAPPEERLSDRPIPTERLDRARMERSTRPTAVSAPVIDAKPTTARLDLGVSLDDDDRIALEREFAAPTPPYALRTRR